MIRHTPCEARLKLNSPLSIQLRKMRKKLPSGLVGEVGEEAREEEVGQLKAGKGASDQATASCIWARFWNLGMSSRSSQDLPAVKAPPCGSYP